MFEKFFTYLKYKKEVKFIEEHPILKLVSSQLRDTLNDKSKGIGKYYSEEDKGQLLGNCLNDILETLSEENLIVAVRMRLINFMLKKAQFDVLIENPQKSNLNISGELHSYIWDLKEKNQRLKEFFYDSNISSTDSNELQSLIIQESWILNLYVNAYNLVRITLGDSHNDSKKDWFRVCYNSFCILQENDYRKELGLVSIISGENPNLRALIHSNWIGLAQDGVKNIRLAWDDSWEKSFNEKSPYYNIDF